MNSTDGTNTGAGNTNISEKITTKFKGKKVIIYSGTANEKKTVVDSYGDGYIVMTPAQAEANGLSTTLNENAFLFKKSPGVDVLKPRNRKERRHGRSYE